MKEIPLTQGKVALVDDADYDWLMQWKWCAHWEKSGFYPVRNRPAPRPRTISMHRLILGLSGKQRSDHINRNTLDNRRANLRAATASQNGANRGPQKNSKFKGVSWCTITRSYVARIMVAKRPFILGHFPDEESAARCYDAAAMQHFGEFARVNFPANLGDLL